MNKATTLYAISQGESLSQGEHQCFYCGEACSGLYAKKDHVRHTFTDFDAVTCPESKYVCKGCVLSMREKVDMGRDKPQKIRTYSWVITKTEAIPYSKADIAAIRQACIDPPPPPFAIVIATSGQKHLIFKSLVNHQSGHVCVCLECERINYKPVDLVERIELVKSLVSILGKPAMSESPTIRMAIQIADAGGSMEDFEQWKKVFTQPISRLAVFLSPSKKDIDDDCGKQEHA